MDAIFRNYGVRTSGSTNFDVGINLSDSSSFSGVFYCQGDCLRIMEIGGFTLRACSGL